MPTGYQRHHSGPMRTSGTFTPPVDDLANSALRARTDADNPEPFTPEHAAAYYAFASVTDRKDARDLHRARVHWDDVNEFGATGMAFTNYTGMIAFMRDGVTPAVLRTWQAALPDLSDTLIRSYTRAGLTPTQVAPYITPFEGTVPPVARIDRPRVPAFIDSGISATRVHHYQRCGVLKPDTVLALHHLGCRPAVLYALRRLDENTYVTADRHLKVQKFVRDYRDARNAGATPDYCNALFATGAPLDAITAWHATDAPTDKVGTLHAAGITPAEYTANPAIADDTEALAALAALRGHTVTAPTRVNAILAA